MKILIADDSDQIINFLLALFRKYSSHKLLIAKNGREAIKMLEENPDIDLVITDIDMPYVNGFGVLEAMKKNNHLARRWLMSGYINSKRQERGKLLGAEIVIPKFDVTQELKNHGVIK